MELPLPVSNVSAVAPRTVSQDFEDLLGIAIDALKISPPLYVSSIMGLPWSWVPPFNRYSEFRILDLWRLRRSVQYVANALLPAIPRTPPVAGLPIINRLFWQPTVILQRPDHYGNYTTYPREAWFFLNGIMTNDAVAQVNAAYLAYLFHRPITLIQNSTCSMFLDLLECALGKQWYRTTEAATKAFPAVYDALKSEEKQRVVVIAHSQGTIIAAVILRLLVAITRVRGPALRDLLAEPRYAEPEFVYPDQEPLRLEDFEPLSEDELAKLEIYCFANCATSMRYLRPPDEGERPVPWIESFGNENDIVARLGMLAPRREKWAIQIDGPRYERVGAWGHLLNEHYLFEIARRQKRGYRRGGCGDASPYHLVPESDSRGAVWPRLFDYINGGTPA